MTEPSTPKPPYPAFGSCIYCRPGDTAPQHLGDEHIIPLSFGGRITLPRASCRHHETITSRFETHCLEGMIGTARYHLGLRGRQKFKRRDRLPVLTDDGIQSVPIADHPSALIMPKMPPPTIYYTPHRTEDLPLAVRICITPVGKDMMERAKRIGKSVNLTKGIIALDFYRFIAKIAHSYASAELGRTFEPFLINLINCETPTFASHLIGGGIGDDPPKSEYLHEIEFIPPMRGSNGKELLRVRIRLFSNLGMPNHYAFVGAR
jgi:hypothetical protein